MNTSNFVIYAPKANEVLLVVGTKEDAHFWARKMISGLGCGMAMIRKK